MTSTALAGVAATDKVVLVADRDLTGKQDVFRCLDAITGKQTWEIAYDAEGKLDYGNSPRATPLITGDRVYFLGAFGHLHCVQLVDGEILWKKNLVEDYKAELVTWGMTSSPLIVDDKLIVNPGSEKASIVALDPATGKEIWASAGQPAAYASFVVAEFHGVRQLIGYDKTSLGGWDVKTGKRLWELVPPKKGDFNVPTPIPIGDKLLVASENNGTRIYSFKKDGTIEPKPVAKNDDLNPDTATPVVLGDRVFGAFGKFHCLDLKNDLKTKWSSEDEAFEDYVTLIGGATQVLVTTKKGEIILVDAQADEFKPLARVNLFEDEAGFYAQPAIVGNRLYVRNSTAISCLELPVE